MVQKQALRDLERNCDGDWIIGVIAVIEVVPIAGVVEIHIIGLVPGWPPGFRPWIDDSDPVSIVLEARQTAYEYQGKAVDVEEVLAAEVEAEAGIGNAVAGIATALSPALVVVFPRAGAGLSKALADLALLLRNTALVDAAEDRPVRLHAAVNDAAIALLLLWLMLRWPGALRLVRLLPSLPLRMLLRGLRLRMLLRWLRLLMLLRWLRLLMLLCGLRLLMLLCRLRLLMLLRGLCLLMLLRGLRVAPAISLPIRLCIGDGGGGKEQRQNRCADHVDSFHWTVLLFSATGAFCAQSVLV